MPRKPYSPKNYLATRREAIEGNATYHDTVGNLRGKARADLARQQQRQAERAMNGGIHEYRQRTKHAMQGDPSETPAEARRRRERQRRKNQRNQRTSSQRR